MRSVFALLAVAALAGCANQAGKDLFQSQVEGEVGRSVARMAVNSAVASYLPGVDAAPFTDCIIDNADGAELLALGQAGGTAMLGDSAAASQQAWPVVRQVASRPATTQCLAGALNSGSLLALAGGLR